MKERWPLVEVEWQDARSTSGWKDHQQMADWAKQWRDYTITTVGYLIRRTPTALVLSNSRDQNLTTKDAMFLNGNEIPRRQVRKVRHLSRRRS